MSSEKSTVRNLIGCILLFLNAIVNIFKTRTGHFLFAFGLMVWVFVTVCVVGLLLRDMRNKQFKDINGNDNCSKLLDGVHKDNINSICSGGKYLAGQGKCTKKFLVSKWETTKTPGFINPTCCTSVLNYLVWPLFITGCLTLLMIAASLIAIGYNLYLGDKTEYLEFENKKMGLAELLFAALCLITIIVFAFYSNMMKI